MSQAETKERILTAAKHEFSEKGFDGARMGAIAKKAKANQALIHYYFESKEKLYEKVLLRLFGVEQNTRIINFFDKKNLNPSERLYMEIYFLVNLYIGPKDPDFERILLMQIGNNGLERVISIINKFILPQFEFMENNLKEGVNSGEFEISNTMYVILELVLFITHYEKFRMNFKNTKWFEQIYGEGYSKRLFDFLVEHTFKSLRASGKELKIPVIPDSIIKEANKTIDSIIGEINGGVDE
jgi:AcrR family transcriptional regulator